MEVTVGIQRKMNAKELILLDCGVEDYWDSLGCKEIQPVHSKGDQPLMLIGRTDIEAEAPILWPPNAKSWLIGKDPASGKYWCQEEKGTTEDKMVELYHRLDGHRLGRTVGVDDGQGCLAFCSSWGSKELNMTEQLNKTHLNFIFKMDLI